MLRRYLHCRVLAYNLLMGLPEIDHLSTDERLRLLERLWDSLSRDLVSVPLTGEQRTELDRRIEEMDADDQLGIPWEAVLKRLEADES